MDFYLLRNGEQTGPFTEPAMQTLLKSGDITLDDFAWRDGLPTWQPLSAVLYPKSATQRILPPPPADAPIPTPEPFMSPVAAKPEAATARQKAFLTYLGISFAGDLTKERAAVLLNDAADDAKHKPRIKRWDDERLRLHPELFAEEIQERRENRPQRFLEICRIEGSEFFHDVTRAHAQVLVGYLDVQYPNWDDHADAKRYFFAAIAEKFPQLVKSGAKGQLKFPAGSKLATEMERSGATLRSRKKRSPVVAAFRGIGLGLVVLAALYGVHAFYENHLAERINPTASATAEPDVPLPTPPSTVATTTAADLAEAATPIPSAPASTGLAKAEPAPPAATTTPEPAAPPTTAPEATPAATMVAATTLPPVPTMPDAAPPAVPMAATATPAPIPSIPDAAPPAIPMTAEPTPAPAPRPPGSLLEPPPLPGMAATPTPRTSVKITKPTQVTLRFGSSTLSAGTVVPLVSVDAVNATVRFGPDVITVPLANTDLAPPQ